MRLSICIMDTVNSKISNQVICWTFWTWFVENVSWPLDEILNELFQFIFKQKDEEVIRIAKQLYSHWSVWPATTGCLPHANDCFQNTLSEQLASLFDEDSHSISQCEVRALSIMRNNFVLIFMSISDCARGGFVSELCVGIARSAVNIRCKPGWCVLIFLIHIDAPHCSRFWRHPARRRSCMQSSTFKKSMRLQTTTCKDSRFSLLRHSPLQAHQIIVLGLCQPRKLFIYCWAAEERISVQPLRLILSCLFALIRSHRWQARQLQRLQDGLTVSESVIMSYLDLLVSKSSGRFSYVPPEWYRFLSTRLDLSLIHIWRCRRRG